uniref:Putative ovule protein n=1 Tax=Solanum chacoense TaxID=4108 RepID=A0A0V0GTB7_SOLCH
MSAPPLPCSGVTNDKLDCEPLLARLELPSDLLSLVLYILASKSWLSGAIEYMRPKHEHKPETWICKLHQFAEERNSKVHYTFKA